WNGPGNRLELVDGRLRPLRMRLPTWPAAPATDPAGGPDDERYDPAQEERSAAREGRNEQPAGPLLLLLARSVRPAPVAGRGPVILVVVAAVASHQAGSAFLAFAGPDRDRLVALRTVLAAGHRIPSGPGEGADPVRWDEKAENELAEHGSRTRWPLATVVTK